LAVKIRLRRVGAKKQPSYRLVIADSRSPRDGRFIDVIGSYNPRTKPTTIVVDEEKARKWLSQGALPTESVASILYRAGIVDMRSERYRQGGTATATAPTPAAATETPAVAASDVAPAEAATPAEPIVAEETAAPEPAAEEAAPATDTTPEA
jgi:small subunit ribosomal protein S16